MSLKINVDVEGNFLRLLVLLLYKIPWIPTIVSQYKERAHPSQCISDLSFRILGSREVVEHDYCRIMPQDEKLVWFFKVNEKMIAHMQKYPDYRFCLVSRNPSSEMSEGMAR